MESVPFVHVAVLLAVLVVCNVAFVQLAFRHLRLLLVLNQRPVPKTAVAVFIECWRTFVSPRFGRARPTSPPPGGNPAASS